MTEASGYPRSGNALTRAIGRLALAVTRFRIAGELPAAPKFVLCVGPHTSNWDFVVLYAAELVVGLRTSWLGKHSLFRGPLGLVLRAMGGIAVDRRAAHGVVGQVVSRFAASPDLVVGLAPEGTRRKVDRWRSGFYHIAQQAGVPIVPVGLDWRRRTVKIGGVFRPTGDEAEDLRALYRFFASARGRIPENAFPPPAD
ncbi:MAG: glycerol acyltransferase [Gemmatimonadetes bacterium]|nr:glycerol acyltransferase [Gemmatimonadota bacterium]